MDIYQKLGAELKAPPENIRAVAEIESQGDGFLPTGEVKILFEPHVFWRCLAKKGITPKNHLKGNEDILYPTWQQGRYGKVSAQHGRLQRAVKIDRDCALMACSYGKFQVLGENYKDLGYKTIQEFVNAASTNEGQVELFVRFLKAKHLIDELQRGDFKTFALLYNGKYAEKNNYPAKMTNLATEYKKVY